MTRTAPPTPPLEPPRRLGWWTPRAVRFEQAVYGSFAFRDQGYALLARSPGCRDEWVAEFLSACRGLGEPPAGFPEAEGLSAFRLPAGVWVVVGTSPQGLDDRGRPGALAFHGIFLSPKAYRLLGADPFAVADQLRSDWSASDVSLPSGVVPIPSPEPSVAESATDPRVPWIVEALEDGRRVALEADGPIEGLAREVWRRLPVRVRSRKTLATWACRNPQRFDLLAVPRLSGVLWDDSYVNPTEPGAKRRTNPMARALGLGAVGLLGAMVVRLAFWEGGSVDPTTESVPAPPEIRRATGGEEVSVVPSRAAHPPASGDPDPEERRRVAESLVDLADRSGVVVEPGEASDPSALMERLALGLRYRGPLLDDSEREELAEEGQPDAMLALEWDRLVRRFGGDRPLPKDFRDGPLRWQLAVLAWSWREGGPVVNDLPVRSASELSQELAESLAVAVPLRRTVLIDRHAALASYLEFLGRLPRR